VIATVGDEKPIEIRSGQGSTGYSNDYSERQSLAITIPDYSLLEVNNEKFHVRPKIRIPIDFSSLLFFSRYSIFILPVKFSFSFVAAAIQ
jgi:hypothetical protein